MAHGHEMDRPDGRGIRPGPSTPGRWSGGRGGAPQPFIRDTSPERERPGSPTDEPGLKTLFTRLGQDVSQLAHDEMVLAKLELRSIADALSADVRDATRTLVKDLAKVGIALSLAVLAGLALTAGAIIGIGALVGAYWAGGLIVGVALLVAAGVFGASAARDLQDSDSLRLEATRRQAGQNRDVLAREARETKRFAEEEKEEFKRHASPGGHSATR